MRIISPEQIKTIDNYCNNRVGLPFEELMERAGAAFFQEVHLIFPDLENTDFIVLCGKGNNGGDGLVTARLLKEAGARADIVNIDGDYTGKIPDFTQCDCILDCIFGTGFRGTLKPEIADLARAANSSGKMIISADIPSGVNGLTGASDENAVRADITVAFCGAKPGHGIYPGRTNTGKLIVREIGIPDYIIDKFASPMCEYFSNEPQEKQQILNYILPKRQPDTHKGSFGKVGIIAGSRGMCGAASLTAEAALRTGAGLVYSFVPEEILNTMEVLFRENVKIPVESFTLKQEIIDYITEKAKAMDSLIIGPGLGQAQETQEFVRALLKNLAYVYGGKIVLDADGLNSFKGNLKLLTDILSIEGFGERVLITPHPAELSRLTGCTMEEIKENRALVASETAKKLGCTVLLKGASTITASPDGKYTINGSGNPGMATAGSGDVLSGIAGTLSAVMDSYDAGRYGAFYHGYLGDRAAATYGEYGMIAGDMLK